MPIYPNPIPNLILLDLNLPDIKGRDVLAKIEQDPMLHYIPPVILTAANSPEDIRACYELGAGGYILKNSVDLQHLQESICIVSEFWLNAVKLPEFIAWIRS